MPETKEVKVEVKRGRPRGLPNPNAGRKLGSRKLNVSQEKVEIVLTMKRDNRPKSEIIRETGLTYYLIDRIIKDNNIQ